MFDAKSFVALPLFHKFEGQAVEIVTCLFVQLKARKILTLKWQIQCIGIVDLSKLLIRPCAKLFY